MATRKDIKETVSNVVRKAEDKVIVAEKIAEEKKPIAEKAVKEAADKAIVGVNDAVAKSEKVVKEAADKAGKLTRKTADHVRKTVKNFEPKKVELTFEAYGRSFNYDDVVKAVNKACKGKSAKKLEIYVNATEGAAYYVLDGVPSQDYRVDL